MQTAFLTGDNHKIYAWQCVPNSTATYYCTNCGRKLHHRSGLVRVAHFYHRPNESCSYSCGESIEHIGIKKSIFNTLKARYENKGVLVDLEYTGIKGCRPDVFIKGKKQNIAIEVQVSPVEIREIIRRTENYFNKNVGVVWVLPFDRNRIYSGNALNIFKKFKMKEYEKLLYFMNNRTLVFWNQKFEAFSVASFEKAYTDSVAFYSKEQGATVSFQGKALRNTYEIVQIAQRKYLEDFQRRCSKKRFEMKGYNY